MHACVRTCMRVCVHVVDLYEWTFNTSGLMVSLTRPDHTPPVQANFPGPRKRPQSSMCPVIAKKVWTGYIHTCIKQ